MLAAAVRRAFRVLLPHRRHRVVDDRRLDHTAAVLRRGLQAVCVLRHRAQLLPQVARGPIARIALTMYSDAYRLDTAERAPLCDLVELASRRSDRWPTAGACSSILFRLWCIVCTSRERNAGHENNEHVSASLLRTNATSLRHSSCDDMHTHAHMHACAPTSRHCTGWHTYTHKYPPINTCWRTRTNRHLSAPGGSYRSIAISGVAMPGRACSSSARLERYMS